jgi:hypothetical protein
VALNNVSSILARYRETGNGGLSGQSDWSDIVSHMVM